MVEADDWCGDSPWGVHGELPCEYCGAGPVPILTLTNRQVDEDEGIDLTCTTEFYA